MSADLFHCSLNRNSADPNSRYLLGQTIPVKQPIHFSSFPIYTDQRDTGMRERDRVINCKDFKPAGGLAQGGTTDGSSVRIAGTKGHQHLLEMQWDQSIWSVLDWSLAHRIPLVTVLLIPGLSIFPLRRCGVQSVLRSDPMESRGNSYLLRNFYSVISNTENFVGQVPDSPLEMRELKPKCR